MGDLTIYDSQGRPLDGAAGVREDERIKDFFFDGVRFALDMRLANEAIIFLRARDNQAARSEQYYAEYAFDHRSELPQLGEEISRVIEEDHEMILDTSHEDTDVFQFLVGDRSDERTGLEAPGDWETNDDLLTLLERGQNLKIGVGSYVDACGMFTEYARESSVNQIAITDSGGSSHLENYDLVVEVGPYQGLEPLGDTGSRLETLREERRKRLRTNAGAEAGSTAGGLVGRLLDADTWAVDFAVGALVLIGLFGGGVVGACFLGLGPQGLLANVPVPGSGCINGGSPLQVESVSYDAETDAFMIVGNVSDETLLPLEATVRISESNSTNASASPALQQRFPTLSVSNGSFTESIPNNGTLDPQANRTYVMTMSTNETDRINHTFTVVNPAGAETQSTRTETPTGATPTEGPRGTTTAPAGPTTTAPTGPTTTTPSGPTPTPTDSETPTDQPGQQAAPSPGGRSGSSVASSASVTDRPTATTVWAVSALSALGTVAATVSRGE